MQSHLEVLEKTHSLVHAKQWLHNNTLPHPSEEGFRMNRLEKNYMYYWTMEIVNNVKSELN